MRTTWMGLTLLLGACGANVPTESTVTSVSEVCVDGDAFVVTFNTCLSSSCDTLVSSSCTVDYDGTSVIEISGEAVISSVGGECTADCGFATARCDVPAGVDRSTVIVQFGGDDGGPTLDDATCDTVF